MRGASWQRAANQAPKDIADEGADASSVDPKYQSQKAKRGGDGCCRSVLCVALVEKDSQVAACARGPNAKVPSASGSTARRCAQGPWPAA